MNAFSRIAKLHRELASAYDDLAIAHDSEYFDQKTSPLGARLHCRLVRSGELVGYKIGHRLLVRREDVAAYLKRFRVEKTETPLCAEDEDDALLAAIGGGKAA